LKKTEVRELSRELGLPTWDKPALACLSSRIPHGTPITLRALNQVDRAESYLRKLGVGQVRVRHHGDTARIEVEPRDFLLVRTREREIAAHLESLGFANVVIDPEGYRSSMASGRDPITIQPGRNPSLPLGVLTLVSDAS